MVDEWDRDALLAPIGELGTGEDISFSLLIDQIKEARRADATYLSQGDWQADLKTSDWNQVVTLCAQALAEQSKDLMLAGWLCEGLAHRDHFPGMAHGLGLVTSLCQRYWDALYPSLEDGDEERLARLIWLDDSLAAMVGSIPLLDGQGYGLARYAESRQVENQARHDAEFMETALAEGKINAEIFQRSVVLTETATLLQRHRQVTECHEALAALEHTLTERLGDRAPGYTQLSEVLGDGTRLLERLLSERGVSLEADDSADTGSGDEPADGSEPENAAGPEKTSTAANGAALRTTPHSREEAFDMLNGVAQFFKDSEPHSPVPYLVERAVRWGRMPLEEWLRDVIREDQVIDSIRETLGTQRRDEN